MLDKTKIVTTVQTCKKDLETDCNHQIFFPILFCRQNCRENLMDEDEKDRAKR